MSRICGYAAGKRKETEKTNSARDLSGNYQRQHLDYDILIQDPKMIKTV